MGEKGGKCRILVIVSGSIDDNWTWFAHHFDPEKYHWEFCCLNTERTGQMLTRVFQVKQDICSYDMVISWGIGYCISFAVALRLKLLGKKAAHVKMISYSFVQTRRLFKTKFAFINNIVNSIFDRSDIFVTHSLIERKILSEAHNLAIKKFVFSHWGYELPEIKASQFSNRKRPYVCCIGRNNRDFNSFAKAIEGLDVDGILITASYNLPTLGVEQNEQLKIYTDLDMNDCLDCIRNSVANIMLVNHGDAGAGHITLVVSMFLGKVQILTEVKTIEDYFIGGIHGYTVAIADDQAVREAIIEIMENEPLRMKYEHQARDYARKWLGDQKAAAHLKEIIDCLLNGQEVAPYDENWARQYKALTSE